MFIQVYADEDMQRGVEIPVEEDGTVSLEILQIEFEEATGLKSRANDAVDSNIFRLMPPSKDGRISEPEGGWQSRVYIPTYKANKSKAKLDSLLTAPVYPPETFDSQADQRPNELYKDKYYGDDQGNNDGWAHNEDPYAMSMPRVPPLVSPMMPPRHPRPMAFPSPILPLSYQQQSYMGNDGYSRPRGFPPGKNPYRFNRYNPMGRGGGPGRKQDENSSVKRLAKEKKEPVGTDDVSGGPIFIYGLEMMTSENDVYKLFAPFGNVEKIDLMVDMNNGGYCKGFAFVTMSQKADAIEAIKTLDGHKYNQKFLQVRFKADS